MRNNPAGLFFSSWAFHRSAFWKPMYIPVVINLGLLGYRSDRCRSPCSIVSLSPYNPYLVRISFVDIIFCVLSSFYCLAGFSIAERKRPPFVFCFHFAPFIFSFAVSLSIPSFLFQDCVFPRYSDPFSTSRFTKVIAKSHGQLWIQ